MCSRGGRVEPSTGKMSLGSNDLDLFDSIAAEQVDIAGTEIDMWHLNTDKSEIDPLYDEFIERIYDGPYTFKGFVTFPDSITSAGEEGFQVEWNCQLWVARKTLEDAAAPTPVEGNICRFWNIPFFEDYKTSGKGYFFDLINVSDSGHVHDSPAFTGFQCILKRRSAHNPERKIFPP